MRLTGWSRSKPRSREMSPELAKRQLRLAYVAARRSGVSREDATDELVQAEFDYTLVHGKGNLPEGDLT